jgi:uncharacterized protein YjbJ (UPF0337 family)
MQEGYTSQAVSQRNDLINNAARYRTTTRATARAVASLKERSTAMSGKTDQIKGRIKEAAGALTDDERLKREGKLDQAVGKVKIAAEKVVDKVKDAAEKAVDKLKDT